MSFVSLFLPSTIFKKWVNLIVVVLPHSLMVIDQYQFILADSVQSFIIVRQRLFDECL